MKENEISERVIGCAIKVQRQLGPGLLESAYEECLCHELSLSDLAFKQQQPLPVDYKGIHIDCGYRVDIVVEGKLVLELKACEKILPVHKAQLLTYLKLSSIKHGLLMNFNVPVMKDGITRLVN